MLEEKKTCKNCGAEFTGKHCPDCGQAANVERFSIKEMLNGLYLTLYVADNTFYKTVGSLFYRPGNMVREYLIGERVKYLKPVKMLVVLAAVYIIITNMIVPEGNTEDVNLKNALGKLTFLGSAITSVLAFFHNRVYVAIFSALLCALPYKWMFHKCEICFKDGTKDSLNLAEHFYTLVFISCQRLLISYLEMPIRLLFGYEMGNLESTVLNVILHAWCYKQLLGISWGKSIWKVSIAQALTLASIILFLGIIVVAAVILDPSFAASLKL